MLMGGVCIYASLHPCSMSIILCSRTISLLLLLGVFLFHISAVFQLPEGKMLSFFGLVPKDSALDIPNGILGMLFYTYVFIRCNMRSSELILLDRRLNAVVCSLALASSVFLARKLYIIKEICVVCLTTHVLNTTVFCRAILEVVKKQKDKVT